MVMTNLTPRIYSLLICSQVERDPTTGSWRISPFSQIAVTGLPTSINMVLFTSVIAPPGEYPLSFRIFPMQGTDPIWIGSPATVVMQSGKNVEYVSPLNLAIDTLGLYFVEASLGNYDIAYTPLRVSKLDD